MRVTLALLYAAVAAASPNPQPQADTLVPSITLVNTTSAPISLPTLPSGNFSIPISLNTTFTGTVPPSTITPTATLTSTRSHKPHTEPIPIFTSECGCPDPLKAPKPCWATDALQRCNAEEISSEICWFVNKGCPTPTRDCTKLFKPTSLGWNPCAGPDTRTMAPPAITEVPLRV